MIENKGGKTAGVDKVVKVDMKTIEQYLLRNKITKGEAERDKE